MATPYTAVITVKNSKGQITSVPLAGDDVTAHNLTFPDASTINKLSSLNCAIIDFILPSSSISQCSININGIDQGIRVQKSASAGTTVNRQIQSSPIFIPAGSNVAFIQIT